jgi:hypothetical protein
MNERPLQLREIVNEATARAIENTMLTPASRAKERAMTTNEPTQDDDRETFTCESCRKVFDIEQMNSVAIDGGYWCNGCREEFREVFDTCEHDFEPYHADGEPGKVCKKCNGFVADDEPTQASAPTDKSEWVLVHGGKNESR